MSDCNGGYWKSEICLTPTENFCCGTKENFLLAQGHYYEYNSPLSKVEGEIGVYEPWAPGKELCAIAQCELDLTEADEPCSTSVCTGVCCGTLINPKAICWPEETIPDDIEQLRCNAKCCLKLAQTTGCC